MNIYVHAYSWMGYVRWSIAAAYDGVDGPAGSFGASGHYEEATAPGLGDEAWYLMTQIAGALEDLATR